MVDGWTAKIAFLRVLRENICIVPFSYFFKSSNSSHKESQKKLKALLSVLMFTKK
jgi:hypothetical protein